MEKHQLCKANFSRAFNTLWFHNFSKVAPYSSRNSTNIKRDHTFNIENISPQSTESQRQSKQAYIIFSYIIFLGFLILSIMAEFLNQPFFSRCNKRIDHSHSKILRCLWNRNMVKKQFILRTLIWHTDSKYRKNKIKQKWSVIENPDSTISLVMGLPSTATWCALSHYTGLSLALKRD